MNAKDLTDAEMLVLGLVAEMPRHGYQLEQVIEERGMREWTQIGFSSIYFVLSKLETMKLVAAKRPAEAKGEYQSEEDLFRDESRASGTGDADAHSAQNGSSNVFIRTAWDDQLVRAEAGQCAAGFAGATQRDRSESGASEQYSNRPTTFAGLC